MRRSLLLVLLAMSCNIYFPPLGGTGGGSSPPPSSAPPASSGAPSTGLTPQQACLFNCAGCCTTSGTCMAGTAADACGSGGQTCVACPSTSRCENAAGGGQCQSCSQLNCAGCCTGEGLCVAGTSDTACGTAGQQCVECTGVATCDSSGVGGGACR